MKDRVASLFFLDLWKRKDNSVTSLHQEDKASIGLLLNCSRQGWNTALFFAILFFRWFSCPLSLGEISTTELATFIKWKLLSLPLRCVWSEPDVNRFPSWQYLCHMMNWKMSLRFYYFSCLRTYIQGNIRAQCACSQVQKCKQSQRETCRDVLASPFIYRSNASLKPFLLPKCQ